jgi:hypothetical protein
MGRPDQPHLDKTYLAAELPLESADLGTFLAKPIDIIAIRQRLIIL